mmetsp:Transcript_7126/g.20203  ORF Transcript_7126/g.20203 Transcript_7126/m.20203 type:complete len:276 (+) Transcript_7126:154-981(+)
MLPMRACLMLSASSLPSPSTCRGSIMKCLSLWNHSSVAGAHSSLGSISTSARPALLAASPVSAVMSCDATTLKIKRFQRCGTPAVPTSIRWIASTTSSLAPSLLASGAPSAPRNMPTASAPSWPTGSSLRILRIPALSAKGLTKSADRANVAGDTMSLMIVSWIAAAASTTWLSGLLGGSSAFRPPAPPSAVDGAALAWPRSKTSINDRASPSQKGWRSAGHAPSPSRSALLKMGRRSNSSCANEVLSLSSKSLLQKRCTNEATFVPSPPLSKGL